MDMLEKLKECYVRYEKAIAKAKANSSPFAGLFGMGGGVKNDPCHVRYYEEVGECMEELRSSGAGEEECYACVRYILVSAAEHNMKDEVYGMLVAIHGCVKDLIPKLSREHRQELLAFYLEAYPKLTRLPVQDQVLKLLKK